MWVLGRSRGEGWWRGGPRKARAEPRSPGTSSAPVRILPPPLVAGVRVIGYVDPTDERSRAVRRNPVNHVVAERGGRRGREREGEGGGRGREGEGLGEGEARSVARGVWLADGGARRATTGARRSPVRGPITAGPDDTVDGNR